MAHALHLDGKAYGGIVLLIKSSIRYHEIDKYQKDFLQPTSVVAEEWLHYYFCRLFSTQTP